MFNSLSYSYYDTDNECNVFKLYDTCARSTTITSAYGSPSVEDNKTRLSNTLTLWGVLRHYESKHLNVALNLASYYFWLYEEGFDVNKKLIKTQFELLDKVMSSNIKLKYFNNTIIYLTQPNQMPCLD